MDSARAEEGTRQDAGALLVRLQMPHLVQPAPSHAGFDEVMR